MSVLTSDGAARSTGPARPMAAPRPRGASGRARPVRPAPIDAPWLASDLIRSGSLTVIGLIGLAVCWFGISGEAYYGDQLGWLVGAVGSLVFSAFGIVGWLLAGIREVHREMAEVMAQVRTDALNQTLDVPVEDFGFAPVPNAATAVVLPAGYVTNASMTRVHRSTCQFVQGRDVEQIDVAEIELRGLSYCGVCCT